MIGKVIEGRYAGASVNKLPDKNVLYIQTEDGTKIALSKSNAISIDDVTDQYPSYGRKVMMVMWNDFETSIIQLGVPPRKVPTNQETTALHCSTKKEVNYKAKKSKQHKISLPWAIVGICLLIVLVLAFLLISSNAKSENNNEPTSSMVNSLEEITAPDNSAVTSNDTAEKELVIGEWILLNIDGVTLNFRFDGFSPLQDHLDFGKHVYLLCAIENTSLHDYDTYSLFEYNITIKDAEGFSVPHSSSGWNYEGYDCFTDIGSGEKKKTVQAYDYNGDISELSITIDAGDCIYTYIHSDGASLSDVGKEATSTISEASSICSKAVGNELDGECGDTDNCFPCD